MDMKIALVAVVALVISAGTLTGQQPDYAALWDSATPFGTFLENVKARQEQWRSRFSNAAIESEALSDARALPGKRRILAVAEDRCSDSAWAVPYLAKLAAAVPDKLELRVISAAKGRRIQSAHLTPDGRTATPTIVILDEENRYIGAWVERPSELQKWYVDNKASVESDARYEHLTKWYTEDAGRTTIREVLAILRQPPAQGK